MSRIEQIYQMVKNSPLFDPNYYLSKYQNILPENCDPVTHFIHTGWKKGLNPSSEFDVIQYLRTYPDVKKAKINPLVHYLQFGINEQRIIFKVEPSEKILGYVNQKKNGRENFADQSNNDGIKIDNLLPIIKSLQNSEFNAAQVESLIDDYYEIYFQFMKFKQKPIIRIAYYFDRHLPDNKAIQKVLSNTLHFYSVLKNKGLQGYFKEAREKNAKMILNTSLSALDTASPILSDIITPLSQKIFEPCVRYYASHPPLTSDVLYFSSVNWHRRSESVQNLVAGFVGHGHRVFYIEPNPSQYSDAEITQKAETIYVVNLPRKIKKIASPISTLSNDESSFLELAVKKVKYAFNINSALMLTDLPFWRKLLFQLRTDLGWKLIYNRNNAHYVEETIIDNNAFSVTDDQKLLTESDLVFTSPELIEDKCKKLFPKISVVIVTYNNLDLTKLCLDSIHNNTEYPNYEVIVVDNASSDETVSYMEQYKNNHKNIILIKNEKNLGFAGGNNNGVKFASGDYLVFLNNDTIVTPGWLHTLLFHLQKDTNFGMVGPVTNAIGNEAKIKIDYTDLTDINYFAAKRAEKMADASFPIKVLALYCCMMSRALFIHLGGLDEQYHIGMFEDDDLAMKLQKEDLQLLCAEDVFIHHFHGASFKKIDDYDLQRLFQENKLKFEAKWGIVWKPHEHRQ